MQFALLLVIIEQCKVTTRDKVRTCAPLLSTHTQPDWTWVFDPILSEEERASLKDYNCTPIPTNEVCNIVH